MGLSGGTLSQVVDCYSSKIREEVIVQRFSVPFKYNVHFTNRSLEPVNRSLVNAICLNKTNELRKVFAIVDEGLLNARPDLDCELRNYFKVHRDSMRLVAPPFCIPGGEKVKDDSHWLLQVHKQLHHFHIDRHSIVLTVGGGAVLDMAGFAAATTHRGVRNVRVPTTLLSQADGGLGVKTGINRFKVKNFLGTFTVPVAVVNDSDFLRTLPPRHLVSGMAEAVKVALIRDRNFFDWLLDHSTSLRSHQLSTVENLIKWSATLHLNHITLAGDPFESGSARPLDFGHWAAHKLESMTSYRLHHGEAVAVGIAIDSRYSMETGLLSERALNRILRLLDRLGLPSWHRALDLKGPDGQLKILRGVDEFKEHIGGDLSITLLKRIGEGIEVDRIDHVVLRRALSWLRKRHSSRCASK
ncbi:MAG TPA: 3-dehydroquinate synthase [Nitrospiraceae bacterium]|nr:3-dehydroquinate synthase [Nitrospiraceae bacterium]